MLSYFSVAEAKPKHRLIIKLALLERATGCNFIITSGTRTEEHNKAVGGVENSYHLTSEALDIALEKECKLTYPEVGEEARGLFNGVIVHPRFIHVDIRPESDKYFKIEGE